jgi:hypothetical protein
MAMTYTTVSPSPSIVTPHEAERRCGAYRGQAEPWTPHELRGDNRGEMPSHSPLSSRAPPFVIPRPPLSSRA